ncbi:MAG: sigma 54-interacting transcriptional regulator [Clostridia bacterium]|nr:sigma 54-interacting transcriptional regulator [Clostridia bacterium]
MKPVSRSHEQDAFPAGPLKTGALSRNEGENLNEAGLGARYSLEQIIGTSVQLVDLKETVMKVAPRKSNVLIRGESGTGKELLAHAIHSSSNRRFGPFVKVNCAAIPENLLESEFFGYEEGAFTGTRRGGQVGKFELAHKGTIFLDEIGEMSPTMQAKLLRVIQEKVVERLGGGLPRAVDVRIVAATNVNLEELIKYGKFRADLYYRLNVVALTMPPLRERKEDINDLVSHFIGKYNHEFGMNILGITPQVQSLFARYSWPGNIRELENVIERAFNLVDGQYILPKHLPKHFIEQLTWEVPLEDEFPQIVDLSEVDYASEKKLEQHKTMFGDKTLTDVIDQMEKDLLIQALGYSSGNKARAAKLLGISRPNLYKKMLKHKLE